MSRSDSDRKPAPALVRTAMAYALVSIFGRLRGSKRGPKIRTPDAPKTFEPPAVHAKTIAIIGLGFLAFTLVVGGGLYAWFTAHVTGPLIKPEARFPEPGLAFKDEAATLKKQQLDAISRFQWIDQGGGLARIPIEEAMRRVVDRGAAAFGPVEQPETEPSYARTGAGPMQRSGP